MDAKENKLIYWIKNKSYAYKTAFIVGGIAIFLAVFFIVDIVNAPKYDYDILVATNERLLSSQQEIIAEEAQKYGEDLNNDGKILVNIVYCYLNSEAGPNEFAAASTKFATQMRLNDWCIMLFDSKTYYTYVTEGGVQVENLDDLGAEGQQWNWSGSLFYKDASEKTDLPENLNFSVYAQEKASSDEKIARKISQNKQLLKNIINDSKPS